MISQQLFGKTYQLHNPTCNIHHNFCFDVIAKALTLILGSLRFFPSLTLRPLKYESANALFEILHANFVDI
jgi:K+-transporting ATPase A subunit